MGWLLCLVCVVTWYGPVTVFGVRGSSVHVWCANGTNQERDMSAAQPLFTVPAPARNAQLPDQHGRLAGASVTPQSVRMVAIGEQDPRGTQQTQKATLEQSGHVAQPVPRRAW